MTNRRAGLALTVVALLAVGATHACAAMPVPGAATPAASEPASATRAAPPSTPAPSACPRTAAARHRWGAPTRESTFSDPGLPADWHPYGPEPGHERNGTRTPRAITVADGVATITGTRDGTTGAMSWHPGQRYGRWEVCVKSDAGRGGLNAVILLWPVAEDWPVGGEVDWMEISDDSRRSTGFFLHYGRDNDQESGSVDHDSARWSAYALEWTPERIIAFLDGEQWYTTTESAHFPPRPMNMTVQLDYFGDAAGGTAMHVDWARQWALPHSEPAQLSLAPRDPATGQPEDYPDRVPRRL